VPFGDGGDGPFEGPGDDPDAPLRGWIHPDDRLWRHPSEQAPAHSGPAATALGGQNPFRNFAMVTVTAVAMAAAAVWIYVLLSPPSARPTTATFSSADSPLTTLAGTVQAVPTVASTASHSLVQLRAVTSHGVVLLTGVGVAEGGLVATTADALSGLRSIDMVGPDGHLLRASVQASDTKSDIALIDVPDDVPVAPFADDAALENGDADMTLSVSSGSNGSPAVHCQPGLVAAIGSSLTSGPALGMPSIVSTASTFVAEPGDPLLNATGDVIGLLYENSTSGGTATTYLPSELVLGVADDLRSGDVDHGWLGVAGTTVTGSVGATVMAVETDSPAAGVLSPGDVIVGLDSVPVRTMAELVGRLYVMAPNTAVTLSVLDGTVTRVVDVTLGSPGS
jgi:S1-C subfamily serine protease